MRVLVVLMCCLCTAWGGIPDADAQALEFKDIDIREDFIAGTAFITRATNETTIKYYSIYFSPDSAPNPASRIDHPLRYPLQAIVDNIPLPHPANPAHPQGKIRLLIPPTPVPAGAVSLIVLSKNDDGLKETTLAILPIVDATAHPDRRCEASTILQFPSAAIEDGSGSDNYTSAVENPTGEYTCSWKISHPNITRFLFRVTHLNLDPFNFDSLCLYDGLTTTDGTTEIECFTESTGPDRPYNILSESNQMQLVLSVKGSISGDGFRAVYYGLDDRDFQNSIDQTVLKIRYDNHMPVNCHCTDVACQGQSSNCIVDEGNGRGFATCNNLGSCPEDP